MDFRQQVDCCGLFGDYYRFYLPFPILIEHRKNSTSENFLYGSAIIDLIIISTILYLN